MTKLTRKVHREMSVHTRCLTYAYPGPRVLKLFFALPPPGMCNLCNLFNLCNPHIYKLPRGS